jgi:ferric-dicitrate binding protein FerR (iron transport regulator)
METRFITYSSIELAGEDRFVRWVLHDEQHHEWMNWIDQQPHLRQKIDEARKLVLSLNHDNIPDLSDADKRELWRRIQKSTHKTQALPNRRKITELWKWGLAAAAALTLVVWVNSITSKERIFANAGEQKEITLPEGSSVTLNAGSHIAYKTSTFEKDRIVHLDGEGFFKVKPGSTFAVETSQGKVTVLGTSFNVFTRGDRFEVSCYTGKVRVSSPKNEQWITAGQKTVESENGLTTIPFSPSGETPGWTTGKFIFDDQPLSEVFDELERQYNISVTLAPGVESMRYTGPFESGDLDEALKLITWPLHLNVVQKGKKITISR